MLLIDKEAALAAIPSMLPADAETRRKAFDLIRQILEARGELSTEDKRKLDEIARLFGVDEESNGALALAVSPFRKQPNAKAS